MLDVFTGHCACAQQSKLGVCCCSAGRGAPEIDILEYGIFTPPGGTSPQPTFVHTMQMAPVAPPYTSWMLPQPPGSGNIPGIHLPGHDTPATKTFLGQPYGQLNEPGFPRTGVSFTR